MAGDLGKTIADFERRIKALEADPNVITARTDAKQIFADMVAKVADGLKAHESAIGELVNKTQLAESGKTLMAQVDGLIDAHRAEVKKALEEFAGHFGDSLQAHAAAMDSKLAAHLESVAKAATAPGTTAPESETKPASGETQAGSAGTKPAAS